MQWDFSFHNVSLPFDQNLLSQPIRIENVCAFSCVMKQ